MKILGVKFDMRLTWGKKHVTGTVMKANKALKAMRLIRQFFYTKVLLQLLISIYYVVLYYNCEEWMISSLKGTIQNSPLTASANTLKWHTTMQRD